MAALLAACSKEPPTCSDDKTIELVKQITIDAIGGGKGLSSGAIQGGIAGVTEEEIRENLNIELSRASSFDKEIKKYNCDAKLISGGAYQIPITYSSQLDDKGQHIVSFGGLSMGDFVMLRGTLVEGITKNRTTKNKSIPSSQQENPAPQAAQTTLSEADISTLATNAISLSPKVGDAAVGVIAMPDATGYCGTSTVRVSGIEKVSGNSFSIDMDLGKIVVKTMQNKELVISSGSGVLSDYNGTACVSTESGSRLLVWSNCAGSACGESFSFFVIDPERLVFLAPQNPSNERCDERCASQLLGNQLPKKINGQ
jgi:hypothetical protein